jgi:hypothetical protein
MGCWSADDVVAMQEDRHCANASTALDDVAQALPVTK